MAPARSWSGRGSAPADPVPRAESPSPSAKDGDPSRQQSKRDAAHVRVTVLGSGSRGNAILVETDGVRLLVDAGFSGRDLERRLAAAQVDPASITALLITHDHTDHTRGMGVAARRWDVP